MNDNDRQNLFKLFRDHGDVLGTDGTTRVALESIIRAIRELKCPAEEFETLLRELLSSIKATEPRITPLIHLVEQFESEMVNEFGGDLRTTKAKVIRILEDKIALLDGISQKMIANGLACIKRYDVIIVYSTSGVVRNILVEANRIGKPFEVLILRQDFTKTRKLIWTASSEDIDHQVIPEYNLSNFVTKANKLFLGATSITPDGKAVCPLGAAEVVGLCHLNGIKIHLFANSLKFSHRASRHQAIHAKEESRREADTSYAMTIHSHCLVDLKHIDLLVREDGIVTQPSTPAAMR
jgi:translation initiation factor eIF-2B subunit alpha